MGSSVAPPLRVFSKVAFSSFASATPGCVCHPEPFPHWRRLGVITCGARRSLEDALEDFSELVRRSRRALEAALRALLPAELLPQFIH